MLAIRNSRHKCQRDLEGINYVAFIVFQAITKYIQNQENEIYFVSKLSIIFYKIVNKLFFENLFEAYLQFMFKASLYHYDNIIDLQKLFLSLRHFLYDGVLHMQYKRVFLKFM